MNFPKTLQEFQYAFNEEGKLRQIDPATGLAGEKEFEFNVYKNSADNQLRYEALGDVITEHVYNLLMENGMHKIYIPDNMPSDDATFVFASKKDLSNSKKLLILIHGSGVVRAGQWSRSLIINQSLNHGTQIPYIKVARELGYDILITNTNDNRRNNKFIPKNDSPIAHATYVWENFVNKTQPECVAIVAHSYGGYVAMDLAKKYSTFFKNNVFAFGLTDSVHSGVPDEVAEHLKSIGGHWIASNKPVNTPIDNRNCDIPRFSAGHTKHEWTSWACMDALFKFFEEKYLTFLNTRVSKKPRIEL